MKTKSAHGGKGNETRNDEGLEHFIWVKDAKNQSEAKENCVRYGGVLLAKINEYQDQLEDFFAKNYKSKASGWVSLAVPKTQMFGCQ